MCGIAGVLSSRSPSTDPSAPLEALKLALRHRGPDDEGIYLSGDRCAGLVHTRLAILDLSPAGHQPMSIGEGRYTIIFNGEIYNFRALRERLASEGVRFNSQSDTEVILLLYERLGPACVRELRGMFTFAIWDDLEKSLFLARGPLGIKPVYYYASGDSLVFASEVRALLASGLVPRRLSPEGLYAYLLYGSLPQPQTIIEAVSCLPAGHTLLWKAGRTTVTPYWHLRFDPAPCDEAAAVRITREALIDSVRHHFVSDVPVSIFLSGGIDSTALVALAREAGISDLSTFSIAFEDAAFDEGEVAKRTARHFGTRHHEWRLDAASGKSLIRSFLESMDQPTIDGFNTFCVSKYAHDHGSKVVLSGLGGDELFGGYSTFTIVPRMVRLSRMLSVAKPVRTAYGSWLETRSALPPRRKLGSFLTKAPSTAAAYRSVRGVFTPREAAVLSRRYLNGTPFDPASIDPDALLPDLPSPRDEVSYLEMTRYMFNQLLRDSDVMSMAWGLELRVPFVDAKLFDTVSRIPAAIRLSPGKRLLLKAVPEVPEWVATRRKQGFTFPFERWIAEEWRDVFQRIDDESPVPLASWYRRWSLLALENCRSRMELV